MPIHATIESAHKRSARPEAACAPNADTFPVGYGRNEHSRERHRFAPGKLVTLMDMLRIHAGDFVTLMKTFDRAMLCVGDVHRRVAGALGAIALDPEIHKGSCDGLWDSLGPLLDEVGKICGRMELNDPISLIGRMRERCFGKVYGIPELQGSLRSLGELIEAQLNDRVLMYVSNERGKYFVENPPPFGELVRDTFPEIDGDVMDASRCLGVGLPTGAVFYLMRVMEFGIRRLAKRLKVKASKVRRKTWDTIIKEIDAAILALSALPNLSPKRRIVRDRCSEATAHLNHVRVAWRNPAMHAERSYAQQEATDIFENVKTFMNFLADKVLR